MNIKKLETKWEIQSNLKSQISNLKSKELINILLKSRGLKTKKDQAEFLSPELTEITAEKVGIDKLELKKALSRISDAIKNEEEIIVFGDYDVDGITGSAILWETLHSLKSKVLPYIPHRLEEGYGLSIKAIDNILKSHPQTKLIITVDNGIVAEDGVAYANKKNIDVIITDHHLPEDKKDKVKGALATVHTTNLCGAGVAYVLSRNIKSKIGKDDYEFEEDDLLELAALGTIADMVPLVGANRAVAYFGIEKLRHTKRRGLIALFNEAGIEKNDIDESKIGHVISPRLNSTGRLSSGMDSLRLICTKDPRRAADLAVILGKTNRERQNVLTSSVTHATELVLASGLDKKKIILISHEEYQEGVIGLIAGRLVEKFYRPSIVISKRDGQSKASVRSVSGINIIEFLRLHKKQFVNIGGHPMAAGFTVETANIDALTALLDDSAELQIKEDMLIKKIKIDLVLNIDLIDDNHYREIKKLEPYGTGNPRPVFMSEKVKVISFRAIGENGKHMKLSLGGSRPIDAVGFGMGDRSEELKEGAMVDIVYTIDENTWNGNTKLQLKLRDFRSSLSG